MRSEPLRLAILGFGIMGERLLGAALDHPGTEVAAVWDPAPDAAARLAAIRGAPAMALSAAAAIEVAEAVYVAAPPAAHVPHGRAALAAGRSLFLEKPLAADLAEARAFVAEAAGARAAVNFPMASSPATARLLGWLPEIGPLREITITLAFATWPRGWQQAAAPWLARRAEGGFTREVASHFLFLAQRIGGPLALIEGQASFPPGEGSETAVRARLTAGALPVTLEGAVGATTQDDHNLFTVIGAAGAVRLRDWSIAERRGTDGTWHPDPAARPNAEMRPLTLAGQLDKLAALTRGEATNLATLAEALSVQEAVEAILAASSRPAHSGGTP
ncbi:MAG: Gfo/Idh/MocA family oxidoreductase [Rubritepida sp.]|nr:Gfo/Idh/MocA family oxidoreductase [Rubritepida sp.]